jgi:D-tyrosyl-tRNA(Tyr) deacylase
VKAVIQRVKHAKVEVDGQVVGQIGPGILTLLGVGQGDTPEQAERIVTKILKLRVFEDEAGKMNRSVLDLGLEHLIVSQFTLLADASSGNRPSFTQAARPEVAQPIYLHALKVSEALGVRTAGGRFQADMKVSLLNDGPVTLVLEA